MDKVHLLVAVSLATPPEPVKDIDAFYHRLDTSSDQTSASEASAPQPLFLVNILNPGRGAGGKGWRAYREDLVGFGAAWVIVFVLVAATAVLLR